jgi:hypothetical protein
MLKISATGMLSVWILLLVLVSTTTASCEVCEAGQIVAGV